MPSSLLIWMRSFRWVRARAGCTVGCPIVVQVLSSFVCVVVREARWLYESQEALPNVECELVASDFVVVCDDSGGGGGGGGGGNSGW